MWGIVLCLELLLMLVTKMVTSFKIPFFFHFASFVVGGKDKLMDEA